MNRNRYILLIFISAFNICLSWAQSLQDKLNGYASNYNYSTRVSKPATYKGFTVDSTSNTLIITFGGGFSEQPFTESLVNSIYSDVHRLIPDDMKQYKLSIVTENHPIEFFVPNSLRNKNPDETRMLRQSYTGQPWVKNISRPYTASRGLENTHISLWQSHGRYWKFDKGDWYWQRPRLFCTTEDLLSQTFVVPYLIPMLQNAGAVVFTPRERDYQSHEVVVDNDEPNKNGTYSEGTKLEHSKLIWHTSDSAAFANTKDVYAVCDTPFVSGKARCISTVNGKADYAIAQWTPNIPEKGRYAVYVTYPSSSNSACDAHYTVYHKGGMTEFNVNQRIGGSTWVYLGTFEFDEGEHDYGKVTLNNVSSSNGVVCADAVRFGGGMGNVLPAHVNVSSRMVDSVEVKSYTFKPIDKLSGLPRWAECAKYSAFWYGMPYALHSNGFDNDEYKNDIWCRSQEVNELSGGSIYNKDRKGRGVPFELNIAVHTDAGYDTNEFIGSLGIYMTDFNEGLTSSGMSRYVSMDLASSIITNLQKDLQKYKWKVRAVWDKNYGETRSPLSPAIILEMLSHQNFLDMQKAYDPQFKFDYCRSVYKSIVKFLAAVHNRGYVIQPLPVKDFCIQIDDEHSIAHLSWQPTADSLEQTSAPDEYILYTREGEEGFDNGQIVHGTSTNVILKKGIIYSFRISALNKGGESFPSEILSAYVAPNSKGRILIVNAFDRLEGPASVNSNGEQGFRLDVDPGVQYGEFTGFCGQQKSFTGRNTGSESANSLGASGNELEGKIVMGNTFDYPYIHGQGIQAEGQYSFCSTSESEFKKGKMNLSHYKMIDVIYGVQKYFDMTTNMLLKNYRDKGGRLLISGANLSKEKIADNELDTIHGCGTEFTIYRDMNPVSYAVPSVSIINGSETILQQPESAFPMLAYSNDECAGSAYNGKDFKSIVIGFPIESIKDQNKINGLMKAFITFLTAH